MRVTVKSLLTLARPRRPRSAAFCGSRQSVEQRVGDGSRLGRGRDQSAAGGVDDVRQRAVIGGDDRHPADIASSR